jgi:hypothetical protein
MNKKLKKTSGMYNTSLSWPFDCEEKLPPRYAFAKFKKKNKLQVGIAEYDFSALSHITTFAK